LGLGINLPAHTVLVKDITRYDGGSSEMMGVNEVMQLFGRAGRPKYDKEGRALIIASTKDRMNELAREYMNAKPEPIDSQLGILPVLRTHILAFIAENFLNTSLSLTKFLMKSFYGHQYGSEPHISRIVDEVIEELMAFEFVEAIKGEKDLYKATRLGKRVSELYIDPLSARWIITSLDKEDDAIGILYTISNTLEMRPYVRATEEAEELFVARRRIYQDKSLLNEYERLDYGVYDPVRAMATALMLRDWVEEKREQEIIKGYHTTPGEIFTKLNNADWMIYSAIELAKLLHKSVRGMVDMRVRLRYGIKEELLDLVRLEQIGRVRARMLFMNGIRTVPDIKKNPALVEKLLGKEIAKRVMDQIP
jgi:helicase